MMKKPSISFLYFFKTLNKKRTSVDGGAWRWKPKSSTGLPWKIKRFNIHHWFVDSFVFNIVSVLEAVALISTACFFCCCCGCGHF